MFCRSWAPVRFWTGMAAGLLSVNIASAAEPAKDQAAKKQAPSSDLPAGQLDETKARDEILRSDAWREMRRGLHNWLSVQQIYSSREMAKIRRDLDAKVFRMSARQLGDFLETTQEKLKILLGPDAEAARVYVRQNLALASESKAQEMRRKLPDPIRMTPEQMREALLTFDERVAGVKSAQAAFDKGREAEIADNKEYLKTELNERDQAINRAYSGQNYGAYGYGGYGGYGGFNGGPWNPAPAYRGF